MEQWRGPRRRWERTRKEQRNKGTKESKKARKEDESSEHEPARAGQPQRWPGAGPSPAKTRHAPPTHLPSSGLHVSDRSTVFFQRHHQSTKLLTPRLVLFGQ